jgi:hypothetical protein
MMEKEIREQADRALAMAEMFQERCHSAEDLLVELAYLPWWRFGEKKKLRKEFEAHYKRFVSVSFNEYLKK